MPSDSFLLLGFGGTALVGLLVFADVIVFPLYKWFARRVRTKETSNDAIHTYPLT